MSTSGIMHKITITGPENFHLEQELDEGILVMGRQPPQGLVLPNARVSRSHAQIQMSGGKCEIMDLGSANGTILNGESLFPKIASPLLDGDVVTIDPFQITYNIVQRPVQAAGEKPAQKPAKAESTPAAAPEGSTIPPKAAEKPAAPQKTPAAKAPAAAKPAESAPVRKAPAPPTPPPPSTPALAEKMPSELVPSGMTIYSERFVNYLPGIYHNDFMRRFLGIFESIWMPLEWTVDNFDLYLSPSTAPDAFIPWLANWYDVIFDSTWSLDQRRAFLKEAPAIFSRRGTRWALSRILEIYTGSAPQIVDTGSQLEAHTFSVQVKKNNASPELIQALIESNKPAHTTFKLEFLK